MYMIPIQSAFYRFFK